MNLTRSAVTTTALLSALWLPAMAAQVSAQDTASVRATAAGILVDFQDADIRTVITALAEAGQLNVIYGDLPSRRITIRLRQPVARGDVLPLLRSIAQSNGLRISEESGIIQVESTAPSGGAQRTGARGGAAQQGELRLFVYRLRHARAAKMAATLQSIFGGRGGSQAAGNDLASGTLSGQLRQQQLPAFGDTVQSVPLGASATSSVPGSLRGEVQIVPDESTNSLLVRASAADYEVIRQAVEAMDLRPLQVMIEVLIAEVRKTRDLDLSTGSKSVGDRLGNRNRGGFNTGLLGGLDTNAVTNFLLNITRGGPITLDLAITALATRGDVRILSRPLVLAQNNQEAKILVGSQRPFVQVFRSLPTDAGVRDQVVQYRDVGTSLTIVPTINPDGYVSLQVAQEVSSATAETQFGAPVISTREASTHLFVRDGQTAVMGGLVDWQRERTRSGVPFLSEIPIIGWLFGSVRHADINSELFLFLTPHIVATDDDIDQIRKSVEQRENGIGEVSQQINPVVPDTTGGRSPAVAGAPVATPPAAAPANSPASP